MSVKPGWRGRFFEDVNQEGIPVTFGRTVMVYRRDQGPSVPRMAS